MKTPYVLRYDLPDDALVGYHCDTFCTLSKEITDAKIYASEGITGILKQQDVVERNFRYIWNHSETYRNPEVWKNYTPDNIQLKVVVLDPDHVEQTEYLRELKPEHVEVYKKED